ncbi:MAG: LysR family transcriptional regulator [Bifidobacteriaceae bacterium]|jgi:DNA-binding transcriptional LysR family regulator|nr:LysR family transcriptional regulator [Bifidobacteriaceae bacterium]
MELRHLVFFAKAAELEHITEAADELSTSQPFVSKTIRELERELTVNLFEHVGRRIRLTEHGRVFYNRTRHILQDLDNAKREMLDAAEAGSHRVSVVTNVGLYMPEIVAALHKADPDAHLTLTVAKRGKLLEYLLKGRADFAVWGPGNPDDRLPGIATEHVLLEAVAIVFSPKHVFCGRESVDVRELDGMEYYTSPAGFGMRDTMDRAFAEANVRPQIAIESPDTAAIAHFVRTGSGFAFAPRSLVNRSPDLYPPRADLTGYQRVHVSVSWSTSAFKSKTQRLFLDLVRRHFRELQPWADGLPADLSAAR